MLTLSWLGLGALGGIGLLMLGQRSPQENRLLALGLAGAAVVYVGFALLGHAPGPWLGIEIAGVGLYGLTAWLGLYQPSWWLGVGWLAHPLWDVGLHLAGSGAAFAPRWYATSCISFDLVVAIYLLVRALVAHRLASYPHTATPDSNP